MATRLAESRAFLILLLAAGVAGCSDDAEPVVDPGAGGSGPGFGTEADIATANALYEEVQQADFAANWDLMPGTTNPIESMAPHTNWAAIYVNDVAAADVTSFAADSIIVKVNLEDDQQMAESYTMMKRIEGFDADIQDWFFAKTDAQGTLLTNGNGVALAGAVGKGGTMGCVPCHSQEDDFVIQND